MKAIIILRQDKRQWTEPLFPNVHPAMVPVCNKPLLEYLIDFMVLSRCKSISIHMETPSGQIQDYFGNGERFGIRMSYWTTEKGATIDTIIDENDLYADGSSFPLIIIDGLFFIHYDKSNFNLAWIQDLDTGILASCSSGNMFIAPSLRDLRNISRVKPGIPFSLSTLKNLDDLYWITMEILGAEQKHYVLPGYQEISEIISGKNVRMGSGVNIKPPVILGNNVKIQDNVCLGPHAVVGNNVILDENSTLEKSILFSNTYVGSGLVIFEKIVNGDKMMDIKTKNILKIDDKALFSVLSGPPEFSFKRIIGKLTGRLT